VILNEKIEANVYANQENLGHVDIISLISEKLFLDEIPVPL
jgi:hypothetical protein